MTAEQFEEVGKSQVLQQLSGQGLSEEEKRKLAAKKLEEVVDKHVSQVNSTKVDQYQDKVKLTEGGWKERYYAEKFDVHGKEALTQFRKEIRQAYIEGLSWVYAYYYNGCASWSWFYPFHYAPFSSDLLGCDRLKIEFELSEPVTPYEQLLSVFPK